MTKRIFLMMVVALIGGCGGHETPATASTPPAAPPPAPKHEPLPDAAFKVKWGGVTMPQSVKANSDTPVTLTLTNASTVTWPDAVTADPVVKDGRYAVRVSYRWEDEHAETRIEIPHSVAPGETVSIPLVVHAPARAGTYSLQFELLQELVVWFDAKGAAPLKVPVQVL